MKPKWKVLFWIGAAAVLIFAGWGIRMLRPRPQAPIASEKAKPAAEAEKPEPDP